MNIIKNNVKNLEGGGGGLTTDWINLIYNKDKNFSLCCHVQTDCPYQALCSVCIKSKAFGVGNKFLKNIYKGI